MAQTRLLNPEIVVKKNGNGKEEKPVDFEKASDALKKFLEIAGLLPKLRELDARVKKTEEVLKKSAKKKRRKKKK